MPNINYRRTVSALHPQYRYPTCSRLPRAVYDTEKLSERIAKLAGGVAVIKVSAWVGVGSGWSGGDVLCHAAQCCAVLCCAEGTQAARMLRTPPFSST